MPAKRTPGGMTLADAIRAWIINASPPERAEYIRTGSRGPGRPVDLAPPSVRERDVCKALGITRPGRDRRT